MFHTKWLQLLRHTHKSVHGTKTIFAKVYYSDKKKHIIEVNPIKELKIEKSVPVDETFKDKTPDEIENITFKREDEIYIMTEKKKESSVTSRLSKECNDLFTHKKMAFSSGINLHLDPSDLETVNWEGYEFDKTLTAFKKQGSGLITAKSCAGGGSGGSGGGSQTSGTPNRIVRGEPGKVFFAFIPEEYFKFFIPRTGVSGFGTFLATFGTFLVSKEYYVLEHNYYGGLSLMIVIWGAIKYLGPLAANALDKQVDEYQKHLEQGRTDLKVMLEEQIFDENLGQVQLEGQLILLQAKRENVALQLEDEFRKRQIQVYELVKNRLDYHLAVGLVHRRIAHKNLVQYVTKEVQKSITPEMQSKLVNISIDNIVAELEKDKKK